MNRKSADDEYSEEETRRRVESALRAAFSAPHKPQSEMKLGKSKSSRKKRGEAQTPPCQNQSLVISVGVLPRGVAIPNESGKLYSHSHARRFCVRCEA
jgi:hypothetical protein